MQAVHVELEREVHPEVIQIRPKTAEERWALRYWSSRSWCGFHAYGRRRMLNMLVGFSALKCGGICVSLDVHRAMSEPSTLI
jgi:hypothetical protein